MLIIVCTLLVWFLVEAILVEIEKFGWATLIFLTAVVGYIVAGHYTNTFHIKEFTLNYYQEFFIYSFAYFCTGVVWSFGKWYFFLVNFKGIFKATKKDFFGNGENKIINDTNHHSWISYIHSNFDPDNKYRKNFIELKPPSAKDSKARITAWIFYWPMSFISTLLNDPFRKFVNFVFRYLSGLYQKMSDKIVGDLN